MRETKGEKILKRSSRLFLVLGLVAVFAISWIVVLTAQSADEKQAELIEQAVSYFNDEIYVLAVPILEEAIGYNAARTIEAENMLKTAYLNMMGQPGVNSLYLDLLDKQMNRANAEPAIFIEAAMFNMSRNRFSDAFAILKDGIARTQSEELKTLYENSRYEYRMGYSNFDEVTQATGGAIGVRRGDFWGIASSSGSLFIPCDYDKVSTYSSGRAVVKKGGVIYAVDNSNNRLALHKDNATDFGNLSNDRIPLLEDGKWYLGNGQLLRGATAFDELGMYSEGYAAARNGGKWGVIDLAAGWLIPCEYDGIIMDALGRAYARGAVFVKQGSSVILFIDGASTGQEFQDARPFSSEGYAAVKKNGKWGFIDITGEVKIDYQFDDALSFGQHLAAVKQGELWGYISVAGKVVIEPEFLEARSFYGGSAPVMIDGGWRFITLLESETETTGGGLF